MRFDKVSSCAALDGNEAYPRLGLLVIAGAGNPFAVGRPRISAERRALSPDEIRRLLETTATQRERFGMGGTERALLYRLAIETGLRANELRSLTVGSFDFERCTVTVESQHTKNHKEAVLPLRADTVAELRQFLAGKLPNVKAFGGTYKRLAVRHTCSLKPI